MSIDIMNAVWGLDLKPAELLVLLCYASFAHEDGTQAFPSIPTVAKMCGLQEKNTRRIVHRLLEHGRLVVEEPSRRHRPTVYGVVVDLPRGGSATGSETSRAAGVLGDTPQTLDLPSRSLRPRVPQPETSRAASFRPPAPRESIRHDPLVDPSADPSVSRTLKNAENGNGHHADFDFVAGLQHIGETKKKVAERLAAQRRPA